MKTFAEIVAEYVAKGQPQAVAEAIASGIVGALQEQNSKIVALEREREELAKAAEIQKFLGYKVSGMREGTVSPSQSKGCKAMENGVAVEAAKLGVGDNGETVLYPPKLWVFVTGKTPTYVGQAACAGFVTAMDSMGLENFQTALRAIGSKEAVTAYNAERKKLVEAGQVAGRK